jgi:hypothetical protein
MNVGDIQCILEKSVVFQRALGESGQNVDIAKWQAAGDRLASFLGARWRCHLFYRTEFVFPILRCFFNSSFPFSLIQHS